MPILNHSINWQTNFQSFRNNQNIKNMMKLKYKNMSVLFPLKSQIDPHIIYYVWEAIVKGLALSRHSRNVLLMIK